MNISIRINGALREFDVEPRMLLVHFIRDIAGLSGADIERNMERLFLRRAADPYNP